ncbi:MAG TPA: hypothetical protein VKE74_00240 [Gemmataceae bacterium]|nr:hypothetical protein [Gemmataceae bacterium]
MMQGPNAWRSSEELDGIVRRVDPVGREVEVHVGGIPISLDIRPDCVITLRGERVKLRLIQPRDWVRVKYTEHSGARVADTIEVQPGGPAPS